MSNTIMVRGYGDRIVKELTANAGITPGHLIERMSTGKVRVHAGAGQPTQRMFADLDENQGKEISDAYVADDKVFCLLARTGDEINAILADGENAAIGDKLESNGNGELRVWTVDSAGAIEYPVSIVAEATEAVDASDSATTDIADRRIKAEII